MAHSSEPHPLLHSSWTFMLRGLPWVLQITSPTSPRSGVAPGPPVEEETLPPARCLYNFTKMLQWPLYPGPLWQASGPPVPPLLGPLPLKEMRYLPPLRSYRVSSPVSSTCNPPFLTFCLPLWHGASESLSWTSGLGCPLHVPNMPSLPLSLAALCHPYLCD